MMTETKLMHTARSVRRLSLERCSSTPPMKSCLRRSSSPATECTPTREGVLCDRATNQSSQHRRYEYEDRNSHLAIQNDRALVYDQNVMKKTNKNDAKRQAF